MGFPTQDNRVPLWVTFQKAQNSAAVVKRAAADMGVQLAGSVPRRSMSNFLDLLIKQRGTILIARDTPGIAQFVKDEFDDQAYDVIADFNAMLTALNNIITAIASGFPKSNNTLLEREIDAQGVITDLVFTAAQSATIRQLAIDLAATID